MPEIGRFFNIDPLAEQYSYNGVYNFSENRVIDSRELEGLEKVSIHSRTFAPYKTFGGGFHGDGINRKYTTSFSSTISSRISTRMNIDLDKKTIRSIAYDSYSDWLGQSITSTVSNSYVKNTKRKLLAGHQEYSTHNYGNNDAFLWGNPLTPDIDTKITAEFYNIDETGFDIAGSVVGDNFPSNETFITDSSGNSIFLGVSGANGNPYVSLFGDNNRPMSSFRFRINMEKGKFNSVTYKKKDYSIEEWNKLFESLIPTDGKTSTNLD